MIFKTFRRPACSLRLAACSYPLAFAELVASSCLLAARFFTLYRSWIAAQQTGSFECRAKFRVHFQQCACDTQLGRFGLSFHATAGGIDLHVIFIRKLD